MKKLGFVIFISALVIGSIFASSMNFGRFSIGNMVFNRIQGSVVLKSEKREVSGFSKIDGSGAINVMGTVLLSVLSGHWRYAHINGVRGDGINPGLLGMCGTVSGTMTRAKISRSVAPSVFATRT